MKKRMIGIGVAAMVAVGMGQVADAGSPVYPPGPQAITSPGAVCTYSDSSAATLTSAKIEITFADAKAGDSYRIWSRASDDSAVYAEGTLTSDGQTVAFESGSSGWDGHLPLSVSVENFLDYFAGCPIASVSTSSSTSSTTSSSTTTSTTTKSNTTGRSALPDTGMRATLAVAGVALVGLGAAMRGLTRRREASDL